MYLCLNFCTVKTCTKRGFRGGLKPTNAVNHLALGLPILFFLHADLPDCCISALVAVFQDGLTRQAAERRAACGFG